MTDTIGTTLVSTPATRAAAMAAKIAADRAADDLEADDTSTTEAPGSAATIDIIDVSWDRLIPDPTNLRGTLTDISDLADSIAEHGLLQPLIVTFEGMHDDPQIIAGHRRHAAIGALIEDGRWPRWRKVPVIYRTDAAADDAASVEQRTVSMLVENLQRVDLDPLEEAAGYARLRTAGWTQARIAKATGRHPNRVSARLRLLQLPTKFRIDVAAGELTLEMADRLVGLPAEVLDDLVDTPEIDESDITAALRRHMMAEAKAAFSAGCAARGIAVWAGQTWGMHSLGKKVATCAPADLPVVLLPEPEGTLSAILELYGKTPEVAIWDITSPPAGKVTGSGPSMSHQDPEIAAWIVERDRVHAANRVRTEAWRAVREELMAEYVGTVTTKDAAAAAMWEVIGQDVEYARECATLYAGYVPPTDLGPTDWDAHQARFLDWCKTPANLTKTVAACVVRYSASDEIQSPIRAGFAALVTERIGDGPTLETVPERPDTPVTIDPDEDHEDDEDDDPDENAHLDAIDDDDEAGE